MSNSSNANLEQRYSNIFADATTRYIPKVGGTVSRNTLKTISDLLCYTVTSGGDNSHDLCHLIVLSKDDERMSFVLVSAKADIYERLL